MWIWTTSMAPWIPRKLKNYLKLPWYVACDLLLPIWIWFLKTWFTTCINSHKIKWTVDFLITKHSLQCLYLEVFTNLYTLVSTCNAHLNLVFFLAILCFNISINYLINDLFIWRCFIHLLSLYQIIRNWEYHVPMVDLAFTQSSRSWFKRGSYM
jgi:hypothetical protein